MATSGYIGYLRVSTPQQGRSGLGIEAQRAAMMNYLRGAHGELLDEFVEIETAKGADALSRRPQLRAALASCKKNKATLLVAKIDRLSRNVHFLTGLMEAKVEFRAADFPTANQLTLHLLIAVAQHEREMTSARTREALAAAKARGVRLGLTGPRNLRPELERRRAEADAFAEKLRSVVESLRARGFSQRAIVVELNALGIRAPRGGEWYLKPVQRVLARLAKRPA